VYFPEASGQEPGRRRTTATPAPGAAPETAAEPTGTEGDRLQRVSIGFWASVFGHRLGGYTSWATLGFEPTQAICQGRWQREQQPGPLSLAPAIAVERPWQIPLFAEYETEKTGRVRRLTRCCRTRRARRPSARRPTTPSQRIVPPGRRAKPFRWRSALSRQSPAWPAGRRGAAPWLESRPLRPQRRSSAVEKTQACARPLLVRKKPARAHSGAVPGTALGPGALKGFR